MSNIYSPLIISKGLTEEELLQFPSDKHLVRLASKVGISMFDLFMVQLGLTRNEWEEVECQYRVNGVMAIKFMALHKWRADKMAVHSRATLGDLLHALEERDVDPHHLCQVCKSTFMCFS